MYVEAYKNNFGVPPEVPFLSQLEQNVESSFPFVISLVSISHHGESYGFQTGKRHLNFPVGIDLENFKKNPMTVILTLLIVQNGN